MSDSLQPHGLQHTRLPCPSPTPGACSNSCSLSRWCHPTISSSVVPFSFHLQSFPVSGSFPMGQFFASGGQRIGVSASASVLPINIQDWFPLGLTGLISLQSKGLSRVFSTPQFKRISYKDTYISSLLNLPPTPRFLPIISGHRAELPVLHSSFPLATYFTHHSIYMSILLSQFLSGLTSSSVPTCPFSTSVSLSLACKQIHLYICTILLDFICCCGC